MSAWGDDRRAWLAAVLLAALVAVAGCASPAGLAGQAGQAGQHPVTGPVPATARIKVLAADYLAISGKANEELDREVDAYGDDEHDSLAAARADLLAEIATERWWDRHLLLIPFPLALARIARAVAAVNQRRIALTERQAGSRTLQALAALDASRKSADAALEFAVRVIRSQLHLPPPDTS